MEQSSLRITECLVEGSVNLVGGSVIQVVSGSVSLVRSLFANNRAVLSQINFRPNDLRAAVLTVSNKLLSSTAEPLSVSTVSVSSCGSFLSSRCPAPLARSLTRGDVPLLSPCPPSLGDSV